MRQYCALSCLAGVIVLASLTLQGCGGSGGGDDPATTTTGKPTKPPTTTTTTVITNPWCTSSNSDLSAAVPEVGAPIPWTPTGPSQGGSNWCASQGPPADWNLKNYCQSHLNTPLNVTGAAAQIKVLTYNLQWWHTYEQYPVPGGNSMNPAVGANIVEDDKVHAFDLMGFQECEILQAVLDSAKKQGLQGDWQAFEYHEGKSIGIGLAWKKDSFDLITQGKGYVAEDRNDATHQYYGKRAAQWVRLTHKATGKKVFYLNHHGPTPVGTGGLCGSKATAYNLLKMIATNAQVGDLVFITGDFNGPSIQLGKYSEEIGTLACHIPHIFTISNIQTVWGIDNHFANCATAAKDGKRKMGQGGSDHWALSVLYDLPGAAAVNKDIVI